jgi:PAS domain S-box-containing protein
VSSAGTLAESSLGHPPERKSAGRLLVLALVTLLFVGTLGGSIWIYTEGSRASSRLSQTHSIHGADASSAVLMQEANDWIRHLSASAATGGLGVCSVVALSLLIWRRHSSSGVSNLEKEIEELNSSLEHATAELNSQRNERRRLDEELRKVNGEIEKKVNERTVQLSSSHAQLQKELNDRRQAERVMAQQAKELERSKDVLELHVQARTQELQKLKSRYESILNCAGEGIYGLDGQGRTTFVNPATAKITGWKVEELVGKSESEVFHRLQNGDQQPGGQDCQLFYRKDGSNFPAEYIRTPIKEKDKEVGAVVIFKDITERKRAEEALNRKAAELARSNAELEQFAYVASHDLQEPLRKIQAFGDRLKTKCDAVNLQDGRDYLERMQSAAARMQTLINDLLTFSRVISASQPFVPVDLNTVAKGVLSDLEVRIEQNKAKLEVGELPTLEADPLQMRQLLQNLIGNALKFKKFDVQPEIKISARVLKNPFAGTPDEDPYAEQYEVTVQDNGIGFDEKYLDKIFAVFQRLHGRNEYEGTGVGLAVCRRITDRHGGTISARSKPGEGAAFIVTLPTRHPKKEVAP